MSVNAEHDQLTAEERDLLDWRVASLTDIGIIEPYASMLAAARHVDIYRAAKMKKAGATPSQIVAILL